ncbi:MAG: hypothetical protein ABIO45_15960 [Burkholderiaceae bacterium]
MHKLNPLNTAMLVAALAVSSAAYSATVGKEDYKARKAQISDAYKADKKACSSLAGNAKDICQEEAKGKEKVARAEVEYQYTGKPADNYKLAVAKADAAYEVAKEKCDDLAGNPKDVCVKEAKAAHISAKADAKSVKTVVTSRADAVDEKRDAQYKVAAEKCDSLSGDAKTSCIKTAKSRYGKT